MSINLLLISAAIVVSYAVITNRLQQLTRPLRYWALEEAAVMLRDPGVSADRKRDIELIVTNVDSRRAAWAIVCAMFVAIPLRIVISRPRTLVGIPEQEVRRWKRLMSFSLFATLCNSPIALIIVMIMSMILSFFMSALELAEVAVGGIAKSVRHRPDDMAARSAP